MGYPDKPVEGRVAGKGWGIFQDDGSTGDQLLPKISAPWTWIRQPQRVPVRIEFNELPEGVELVVGATATVQVLTGTSEGYVPHPPTKVENGENVFDKCFAESASHGH